MNNRFLLANEIKKFILSLDSILINYPKKDIIIKKRIINTLFELLELVYLANNKIDDKINIKYECLSKISMIDFYFEYSYKKNYISLKNLNTYIFNLTKINKMLHGWINNELQSI